MSSLMSTANQSRQLNRDELRRLKWLLGGAVALVSLWTVFFLDIEAAGLVGVVGAVIGVALVWPQLPGRVPPLVWKLAVPGIIATLIADFYFSPDTLPVFIRTGILLVLYRAVGYRRKREDLQLIVLGLFLIVVAGVLTVSLGFAFLLLLFTAVSLGFLFVINLLDAVETGSNHAPETELAWTRLGWMPLFRRLRVVADWRLLLFASALFATVVVISGLLFVLIPRFEVGSGFFLDKYITRKSRTGFSEVVKFGDVSELVRDNSVAMRVDVTDSAGLRAAPYWRLVVLDEYTADGFKVSAGLKQRLGRSQRVTQQVLGREFRRKADTVGGTWTFYIEPGVSRYLPLPGSYGVVRLRDPMPVQVLDSHRVIALRSEPLTMTALQMEGVVLASTVADEDLPEDLAAARAPKKGAYDPRLLLGAPVGEANRAGLAGIVAEITGGREWPAAEFATRASAWLQARHAYALAVKVPRGTDTDAIVRWLESNEPGFCEYFAAGLTVLARAAGYPARVVVGFRGGALNAFENYYMVRNSDAHAWVEIHDGKSVWLRVDPTPGGAAAGASAEIAAAAQVQDSSWSARTDSLRVLWYRRIVNFDARNQVQMLETVKNFTADSGQAWRARLEAAGKRLKAWLAQPWDRTRWLRVGGGVGTGLILIVVAWQVARRTGGRWRVWRQRDRFDPVRHEAGRWLGRLRDTATPPSAEHTTVQNELQRLRYGQRESWPDPQGVFKRARQVKRAARR